MKVINLNNRYMGMVRQWQEFFYDGRYSHSYMGCICLILLLLLKVSVMSGIRIENPGDVKGALEEAFCSKESVGVYGFHNGPVGKMSIR